MRREKINGGRSEKGNEKKEKKKKEEKKEMENGTTGE